MSQATDADPLAAHVSDGRVDYEALAQQGPDALVAPYREPPPGRWPSRAHAIAFYINAYNAAAASLVLRRRVQSPRFRRKALWSLWERFVFFFVARVRIAGRSRTLFGLEFFTIRRLSKDPRIHFALVCASCGCPPLREGRFHAEAIDEELDLAARAFLQPGAGYQLDRASGTVIMSRIFSWYRRDFARVGGARAIMSRYAPADDARWVEKNRPRVRFASYDWSLNVRPAK